MQLEFLEHRALKMHACTLLCYVAVAIPTVLFYNPVSTPDFRLISRP